MKGVRAVTQRLGTLASCFLVRGGNTDASRVSFKVGFTRRVFKALSAPHTLGDFPICHHQSSVIDDVPCKGLKFHSLSHTAARLCRNWGVTPCVCFSFGRPLSLSSARLTGRSGSQITSACLRLTLMRAQLNL